MEKIIAWIGKSSVQFYNEHTVKKQKRLPGTGDWILEDQTFQNWKDAADSELLWLRGNRGCGKSFLASVIIEDLKAICENVANPPQPTRQKTAFAFVYCSSLESNTVDPSKFLCSIIEQLTDQLAKPTTEAYLERIYDRHGGNRPIDPTEIREAIDSLLGRFKETYVVVDGLDELRALEHDQFEEVCRFFRGLTKSRRDDAVVKVVALSRPEYTTIANEFAGCPTITIDTGANEADIQEFITMKLSKFDANLKQNPSLLEDIKKDLLQRAEGMFLWVDLVINSLEGEYTARGLRQKIKDIPQGLDKQYETSLKRIVERPPSIRNLALKILLWITNARRPLQRAELLEVLAVEPGMTSLTEEDRIFNDNKFSHHCSDLIVLDSNEDYHLLHSSLKDFLTQRPIGSHEIPVEYSRLQEDAEKILGETCLTYLNFETFENGPKRTRKERRKQIETNPFLSYASVHWGSHIGAAQNAALNELTRAFIEKPGPRDLSMQFQIDSRERRATLFHGPSNVAHILSMFDLIDVAGAVSDLNSYQKEEDGFSALPLDYTLIYGSRKMCNRLLQGLDELDFAENLPNCRCLPIHRAAAYGWDEVVKNLITLGYEPTAKGRDEETPLHAAAAVGGSLEVLEILISAGVDIDVRDADGATALLVACEENHTSFARRLIDHGADVTLADSNDSTALHHATKHGDLEFVKLLLRKGVDKDMIREEDGGFRSALHIAAQEGLPQVLQCLVDDGALLDQRGSYGWTALQYACLHSQLECLTILLKAGATVTLRDHDGRNAIHTTSFSGNLDVLKLLFSHRPNDFRQMLNEEDSSGATALAYAAIKGYPNFIKFLMEKGAAIDKHTKNGLVPIHLAVLSKNLLTAKMMLEVDSANAMLRSRRRETTLHYLTNQANDRPDLEELTLALLEAGADAEAEDDEGLRPIHWAASSGNLTVATCLRNQVPNLNLRPLTKLQETPLHHAAANGSLAFVEFLLSHEAPMEQLKSSNGNLPVHVAAWNGHVDLVKRLLTPENVNEPGQDGCTALFGASSQGHLEIVRYLLENGANPDLASDRQVTPLARSTTNYYFDVANVLLDWNADPNITDRKGMTVLHRACHTDDVPLVKRLMQGQCDPNRLSESGVTPFTAAVAAPNPKLIDIFTESQIDGWSLTDACGMTCLHDLAAFGSLQRLAKLQHHFSPDDLRREDAFGANALIYAAFQGHVEVIDTLIKMGVPSSFSDACFSRPLHDAARNGFVDTVQRLVDLGLDVNEQKPSLQRTPLHEAVIAERLTTAEILIKAGADVKRKDALGLTCLDYVYHDVDRWETNPLFPIDYKPSKLVDRLPCLKESARTLLQRLLSAPNVSTPREVSSRIRDLEALGTVLMEMRSPEAESKAAICFLDLASPAENSLSWWWEDCQICGTALEEGPFFLCRQSLTVRLCDKCHTEYDTGEENSNLPPVWVVRLEDLETEMRLVRRALKPFIKFGTRFLVHAFFLLGCTNSYLGDKSQDYGEWLRKYNSQGQHNHHMKPGLIFAKHLVEAIRIMSEPVETTDLKLDSAPTLENCWAGFQLLKPDTDDSVDGTPDKTEDLFIKLDRSLSTFHLDNEPDKELDQFSCFDHEYIKIGTVDTATEEQKQCFENGRIKREWFQSTLSWLEQAKFDEDTQTEIKPSSSDTDTKTEAKENTTVTKIDSELSQLDLEESPLSAADAPTLNDEQNLTTVESQGSKGKERASIERVFGKDIELDFNKKDFESDIESDLESDLGDSITGEDTGSESYSEEEDFDRLWEVKIQLCTELQMELKVVDLAKAAVEVKEGEPEDEMQVYKRDIVCHALEAAWRLAQIALVGSAEEQSLAEELKEMVADGFMDDDDIEDHDNDNDDANNDDDDDDDSDDGGDDEYGDGIMVDMEQWKSAVRKWDRLAEV